ncbi:outer membrane beta-barrel protein [Winogradskyella sp.]|uniref:outer membrane beta-barrel protein n=1 Tax=Winogradskyella sp. TaxID=1883156 RepID=UPI00261554E3|nr:outer membrane beta-barrel protein [Winogradskyella sp.]
MKQKLLLTFILIFTIKSFSQNSKFSVEANYPIAIGDNFLGQNYNGLIDLGAKYLFSENEIINIGVSLNVGFFQNTKSGATDLNQLFDVKILPIQPRIFAEFNIPNLEKLHPQIGIGYSILIYNAEWADNREAELPADIDDNENGFNFNVGLSYDITNTLFVLAQYDFIKIGVEGGVPDSSYNTNLNILKFGIGLRI